MSYITILLLLSLSFMFGQDCPDEMEGIFCSTDIAFLQSFIDLNDCIDVDELAKQPIVVLNKICTFLHLPTYTFENYTEKHEVGPNTNTDST